MTKERSWRKDAMGSWQFHWGVTSRREMLQALWDDEAGIEDLVDVIREREKNP